MMPRPTPLERLRALCLSLPEAHEVEAWGEPTFRVRNKMFATYASAGNHHGAGRPSVWIKSTPAEQDARIRHAPDRYFSPPYVGPKGWIGVWLDVVEESDVLYELLLDAYRRTAPRKLLAQLD